jgi:hypothetical protein
MEPQTSGWIGDTVFYNPEKPGPFEDGQDAISNVPDGGTLRIAPGVWDVAEEGPLHFERPINVVGAGRSSRSGGADDADFGTEIRNKELDEPAIQYSGEEDAYLSGVQLRNLFVWHTGESSPAVRFNHTIKTLIAESEINCRSQAPIGIEYDNWAFFARVVRSAVKAFTDIGIHVAGGGYAHEFYTNHVASARPEATALQTEVSRTIVVGGEYAATGENGTGIRFWSPPADPHPQSGGVVVEPGIEHTANPIDIDGESAFEGVRIYGSMIPLYTQQDVPGIRFGNARNCKVVDPVLPTTHQRDCMLAHWTKQAKHCGIVADASALAEQRYQDDGALNPYISITGATDDATLSEIPTGVPTTVEFNVDAGAPVYHDGTSWRRSSAGDYTLG